MICRAAIAFVRDMRSGGSYQIGSGTIVLEGFSNLMLAEDGDYADFGVWFLRQEAVLKFFPIAWSHLSVLFSQGSELVKRSTEQ